jgi:hypothetical protein
MDGHTYTDNGLIIPHYAQPMQPASTPNTRHETPGIRHHTLHAPHVTPGHEHHSTATPTHLTQLLAPPHSHLLVINHLSHILHHKLANAESSRRPHPPATLLRGLKNLET